MIFRQRRQCARRTTLLNQLEFRLQNGMLTFFNALFTKPTATTANGAAAVRAKWVALFPLTLFNSRLRFDFTGIYLCLQLFSSDLLKVQRIRASDLQNFAVKIMVVLKDFLPNNLATWFNNSGFRNKLFAIVVANVFGQMETPRQPWFAFNTFVPRRRRGCSPHSSAQSRARQAGRRTRGS